MTRLRYIILLLLCLPLQAGAQRLRVAFVGDPQVDNMQELGYACKSVYRELRMRGDLDLVVFLGDLVNDDVALLEPTRAVLDSLPFPWACVPGNHDRDFYGLKKGRAVSFDRSVTPGKPRDFATFRRLIGPTDTTFVTGGVRFVLMDDVRRLGDAGYEAGFREEQKLWLRKLLSSLPEKEMVVLATHIPLNEFSAKDSLAAILSVHRNLTSVSAHTHCVARDSLVLPSGESIPELIAGASCGSWWRGVPDADGIPSATMNCGSPRGYFVADFRDLDMQLEWKTVGRPASEQLSAWIADSTRLVINVFGGGADGRVKVRIGPGKWTELPRRQEPAPEEYIVSRFNKALPREGRSRNPLYIPMRSLASPHVWAGSLRGAKSLRPGKKIKVRYEDPAMSFTVRARLGESPGPG